jgi:MoaA/NifB/PqqE/SkfB family radical SAM enzyme
MYIDFAKLKDEFKKNNKITVPFSHKVKASLINISYAYAILVRKPIVFFKLLSNSILGRFFKITRATFRTITIAIGYDCNFNCLHCNVSLMQSKGKKKMGLADYKKLGKGLKKHGVLNYTLTGGEPLVYNNLLDIIEALAPKDFMVLIQTNAALLTDKLAQQLYGVGVDILCVSMDKMHDKERVDNYEGEYKKMIDFQWYDTVLGKAKRAGLKVQFLYVVSDETLRNGEFEAVVNYCFKNKVLLLYNTPIPLGNWKGRDDVLIEDGNGNFLRTLEINTPYARTDKKSNLRGYGCPAFKEKLYITPYGEIQGCTFLQFSLGNIKELKFDEILGKRKNLPYFSDYIKMCPPAEDKEFVQWYQDLFKDAKKFPLALDEFVDMSKNEES